ncbi:acetyl-CoA carboxylase carboxyltransferase subunit alpha [Lachnotalea glycerini]|uniref:acetyl-CoA carboxytransferase n=1 Tax=Lachnotalea glycerini TaxID=1763509 RepID=A0A318EYM3_9FIRM|nr:acetyl-CoA carboxylase carboxyl transferase subunit alpha [Lachnotalea glycerini]PXV93254.1 acetyl-CoA carboxylase carboxyltransferase subunit alpha [Lachnotalea glycerini]
MEKIIVEEIGINYAWNKVLLARKITRFRSLSIINSIFDSFIQLHGDRRMGDDKSIVAGIGLLHNQAVTIIGQQKGNNPDEMEYHQYGMTKPEGYRKSLRLMRQAEKFRRPIICFIDTPGAFPGISAEENGQAEAIARNLYEMANFTVPIISIIIGEGGSGGALALGVANKVIMLENAIYSVVSPEGCASILCKDSKKAPDIAGNLKITATDLKNNGIVDEIISEVGEAEEIFTRIKQSIEKELLRCSQLNGEELRTERIEKYRRVGNEIVFFNVKEDN